MKREPRFDQHIGCWEEPFQDRCERAWDLPREYTARLAQWVSDFMDADAGSGTAYYGYDWWTTTGWGRDFTQIAQRLERACQFATCDVFPDLNRRSLNRIPPHLCLSAIMLPAEKRDGVRHVHGFLRVPVAARSAPLSLLTVQTNGTNVEILAPRAAARVVHYVRQFAHGAPSSFHLDHRDAHAMNLVADRDRREHKLSYLTASGPEVRSWDRLELVPGRVWRRLVKGWDHAGVEHGCGTSASAPPSNT